MTFTKIENAPYYTGRCEECDNRVSSENAYKSKKHSLVCTRCAQKPYLEIKALQSVSNEVLFVNDSVIKVDIQLNIPLGEHIGKDSHVIVSFNTDQLRKVVSEYIEKVSVPRHLAESDWLRLAAKTL